MATTELGDTAASSFTLAPIPVAVPQLPPAADGTVRFSRDAYHRMFQRGVLDPEKRYELLDGEIVTTPPIGPWQGSITTKLGERLVRTLPEGLQCRMQMPIVIADRSEPEPDLAIVRRRADDYQRQHPLPTDVVLNIEVAESSLARDRGQKMQIYARTGVPECWIVDVEHRAVIVHRQPGPLEYADVQTYQAPASVTPLAAPECQVEIAWLFR